MVVRIHVNATGRDDRLRHDRGGGDFDSGTQRMWWNRHRDDRGGCGLSTKKTHGTCAA